MLLTHSGDFFTIDRVQRAVERLGWEAVRFDTDTFPREASLAIERAGRHLDAVLELPHRQLRLAELRAVWLRRLWAPSLPDELRDREACAETSRVALFDALAHYTRCRWVNPLEAAMRAESKLLQLRVAHELGLALPDTVVTNEPAWVERLRQRTPRLVTKLLVPLSYAMQADRFFYTSEVPEHAALTGLRHAPQIFQPLIAKAEELRVVVVRNEFFVAAVDASRSKTGRVDWRQLERGDVRWRRASLPSRERRHCRALLTRLGLTSGALDFIVTPEGRHVFLEVNPAGEWGWLEKDLGFDVSGAFARALTGATAARRRPLPTRAR